MCWGLIYKLRTSGFILVIFIADFVLLSSNSMCLLEVYPLQFICSVIKMRRVLVLLLIVSLTVVDLSLMFDFDEASSIFFMH